MSTPTITGQKVKPFSQTSQSFALTWGLTTEQGVGSVRVYWKLRHETVWKSADVHPNVRAYTITGLTPNAEYNWEIRPIPLGFKAVTGTANTLPAPSPPPPPASGLKLGICGLTGGNDGSPNKAQALAAMAMTGATYDRVDVTDTLDPRIIEGVKWGVKFLVLYSPQLQGRSTGTIQSDMRNLASEMIPLGLTEIEFGNEAYYGNGFNATEYAEQYKAAHKALDATGINLIANLWCNSATPRTDIQTDGGWGKAITNVLGYVPDAWSLHPYGGMDEQNLGETEGWQIVPKILELMKTFGFAAPLHITEVGKAVWAGNDGKGSVTEAEQATDVARYISDSAKWPVDSFYWFSMADYTEPGGDSEGGYGLYEHDLKARPAAAAYGQAAKTASR